MKLSAIIVWVLGAALVLGAWQLDVLEFEHECAAVDGRIVSGTPSSGKVVKVEFGTERSCVVPERGR